MYKKQKYPAKILLQILSLLLKSNFFSSSQPRQQPQSLEQFIESNKIQYGIQKETQTSNEYIAIITPCINQIILLQPQLKKKNTIYPTRKMNHNHKLLYWGGHKEESFFLSL